MKSQLRMCAAASTIEHFKRLLDNYRDAAKQERRVNGAASHFIPKYRQGAPDNSHRTCDSQSCRATIPAATRATNRTSEVSPPGNVEISVGRAPAAASRMVTATPIARGTSSQHQPREQQQHSRPRERPCRCTSHGAANVLRDIGSACVRPNASGTLPTATTSVTTKHDE